MVFQIAVGTARKINSRGHFKIICLVTQCSSKVTVEMHPEPGEGAIQW